MRRILFSILVTLCLAGLACGQANGKLQLLGVALSRLMDVARRRQPMNGRRINPVQRSLSRPLTILGAERKPFFFAMCVGAGTFNLAIQMSRNIKNMPARYHALFSQWRNGSALNTFGKPPY